MIKRLFMLSGGCDSVASLKKHLEEKGSDGVIALHVEFGETLRHFPERKSCEDICAKYQVPLFTHKVDFVPVADFDFLVQCAYAFHYREMEVDEIYFGFTGKGSGRHYSELFKVAKEMGDYLHSFVEGTTFKTPDLLTNIDGLSRKQLINIIDNDTFWSCRNPYVQDTVFEPCGHCGTCLEFKSEGISHGKQQASISIPNRISSIAVNNF